VNHKRKNKRRLLIYFGDTINLQKQQKIKKEELRLYALKETLEKLAGRRKISNASVLAKEPQKHRCDRKRTRD